MVSWMMSIKAVIISSGVASMAFLLKVSVPVAVDFSVSQAPILWSSLLSWLKPPYVYVLTNGIIITIVASSRYYRGNGHLDREEDEIGYSGDYKIQTEQVIHQASPRTLELKDAETGAHIGFVATKNPPLSYVDEFEPEVVTEDVYEEEEMLTDAVAVIEDEDETEEDLKSVVVVETPDLIEYGADEELMAPPKSKWNHLPPSTVTESENLPPIDKPLAFSRFGHRKPAKAGREAAGRALRVAKPKKHDTLENTWKMITEGKSTSLTRHYRRSDTLSHGESDVAAEAKPVYKKSETFKDRTNYYQSRETGREGKVKKETSPSQDELNRRVEAFIQKFNEEMKLQRMESLRQYKEITAREV